MSIISEMPVGTAEQLKETSVGNSRQSTLAAKQGDIGAGNQSIQPAAKSIDLALPEVPPLADVLLEPLVRNTLQEDLGRAGDLTSNYIIPAVVCASLRLAERVHGVLAGLVLVWTDFLL